MNKGRTSVRTVELFAGIGGFRLAADALGLHTVFANDISPLSSTVYRSRFPTPSGIYREGDIFDFLELVPAHEILTAGFPCQPFSFAGKKRGIDYLRATTLDAICALLRTRAPQAFVLENVKSLLTIAHGAHFAEVLRRLTACGYFIEWKVFNVMELGLPQNRQRVLILGTRDLQAERQLGDQTDWMRLAGSEQAKDIVACAGSFPTWGVASGESYVGVRAPRRIPEGLSLRSVLEGSVGDEYDFTLATKQRLPESTPVGQFIDGVEVLFNQDGGRRMGYTIYGVNGVSPTLTATSSRHYERFAVGDRYRRLTPIEYARIQGFSDSHCADVARNQQYGLIGNAIPPALAKTGLLAALRSLGLSSGPPIAPDELPDGGKEVVTV